MSEGESYVPKIETEKAPFEQWNKTKNGPWKNDEQATTYFAERSPDEIKQVMTEVLRVINNAACIAMMKFKSPSNGDNFISVDIRGDHNALMDLGSDAGDLNFKAPMRFVPAQERGSNLIDTELKVTKVNKNEQRPAAHTMDIRLPPETAQWLYQYVVDLNPHIAQTDLPRPLYDFILGICVALGNSQAGEEFIVDWPDPKGLNTKIATQVDAKQEMIKLLQQRGDEIRTQREKTRKQYFSDKYLKIIRNNLFANIFHANKALAKYSLLRNNIAVFQEACSLVENAQQTLNSEIQGIQNDVGFSTQKEHFGELVKLLQQTAARLDVIKNILSTTPNRISNKDAQDKLQNIYNEAYMKQVAMAYANLFWAVEETGGTINFRI